MIKLYTEEQVDKMLSRARLHKQDDTEMFTNEYLLSQETPIELPRYKDIIFERNVSNPYLKESQSHCAYELGFERSAKWIKEQILNQNK